MKPDVTQGVALPLSDTHLMPMRKFYRFKGVNNLTASASRCDGAWKAAFDQGSVRQALVSGAKTVTIFATMSDLQPYVQSGGVRSSWEKVGEHLRRAIEHQAKSIGRQSRGVAHHGAVEGETAIRQRQAV